MKKITLVVILLTTILLMGCRRQSTEQEGFCALSDLPYPRPEPEYSGKLERSLAPFASALQTYTPDQAAARENIVHGKSIPELQALMASGELTSADLVVYYLERIERYDIAKLNSVIELNPEALEIAQKLDDERAAGNLRGLMHGIPVILKDNIATGDQLHTAAGAAAMLGWDPDRDAFLVSQLREAGAIILGKANMSEWANWMDSCMPNGFSANGGQTQNPYGPFDTYGSSSGSAVSVAADLTTVSVGTETQGSIIKPAAINSVVALKTSRGLVSRDYIIPLLPAQDVPGPVGRSVTDVAVLLSAMVGVDNNDPESAYAADLAGTDFTQFLNAEAAANLRVGLPVWNEEAFAAYFAKLGIDDADAQANLRQVLEEQDQTQRVIRDALKRAGVSVVEIPFTALPERVDTTPVMTHAYKVAINQFLSGLGNAAPVDSLEAIIAFNKQEINDRAPYGQDHLEASQNSALTDEEYENLVGENQQTARERIEELLTDYRIDVVASDLNQLYAPAGYPALTIPAGYAEDGTPQDVVFVGSFLSEPKLLAVGYAYEQISHARIDPNLDGTTDASPTIKPPTPVTPVALADTLGNLSYSGLFPDQQIALSDGIAYYDDGSSGKPFVHLIDHLIATGDLNGDGVEDAVALLVDYSTGSGDFIYLVPVLNVENEPLPLDALMIGDRSRVKSLTIDDGQLIVELIAQGPGDPLCCPTWNVRKLLNLEGGQLVEQSSEDLSKVSLDDLNGTSWRLIDLNLDQEPVLPETEITLNIDEGQINGSGGCNNYNSTVSGDDDMPQMFTVESIEATKNLCSDPIANQETTYLQRFATVESWRYDFGYLSLLYKLEGDVYGELLFIPQE